MQRLLFVLVFKCWLSKCNYLDDRSNEIIEMKFAPHATIVLLCMILSVVLSKPTCKTYEENDVVCRAGSQDYVLRRYLVSENNRTTNITLRNCRITDVEYESFENLLSLKYLDLSKNKIRRLKLGVLDEPKEISHLNLSYNLLSGIELGLFDQNPDIEVLDLKSNLLEEIELGVFDPIKKLRHLDLSSNLLKGSNINPFLFDQCNAIRFLDFSHNDMSDTNDDLLHALKDLDLLKLDKCSLKSVPNFIKIPNLLTLRHLVLSTNDIDEIVDTDFKNLVNLEILDFTANKIRSLSENAMKFSNKLKIILLRHNELTTIPETLFQSLIVLNTVDLSHNKIQYVPVNAFRGTKLRNLNVSDNRFSYLQDNFCLELRNSGAILNKFYFNQNPWQCSCLKEILNEVKTYGISYNGSKYNGSEPVCVRSQQFVCRRQLEVNDFYNKMYFEHLIVL